jgi:hypothetical protein
LSLVEQFPYCDRNPASGGLDLMPDLPIVLRHQSRSLPGVGLVDSGASISVLPYSLGLQLGFDWNTLKAHITLGGSLSHVGARGIVVVAQNHGYLWRPRGPRGKIELFMSGRTERTHIALLFTWILATHVFVG